MQLSNSLPFQTPSLPQFIQQFAFNAQQASAPCKASGLSWCDIDDASQRATAKNGLEVMSNPNQAMRSV